MKYCESLLDLPCATGSSPQGSYVAAWAVPLKRCMVAFHSFVFEMYLKNVFERNRNIQHFDSESIKNTDVCLAFVIL